MIVMCVYNSECIDDHQYIYYKQLQQIFKLILIPTSLTKKMLQTKQNNYSTYQSRRNTEIMASRFIQQFKYDINDYLPNQYEVKNSFQFISFGKFEELGITDRERKSRASMENVEEDGDLGRVFGEIRKIQDIKNSEIVKMQAQFTDKQKVLEQKIKQLQKTIDQLTQNQLKITTQNNLHTQKITKLSQQTTQQSQTIKSLQLSLTKTLKQKSQLQTQLLKLAKKLESKSNNIRIFYQKYEVSYEPKPKHSYTIQVQTDQYNPKPQPIPNISIPQIIKTYPSQTMVPAMMPEVASRRVSSSNKPPLYQLYQQQQFQVNQQFDLNSQVTSRSQIFPSNTKPRKPAFMQNPSEYNNNEKQNDRKKLNRLQPKLPSQIYETQKQKKPKIKNEQIEIYPIDCDQIEDIVYGILAMK